ncbi:hypothetical protein EAF04_001078 [Stromatinia cepivora]|nr:hypothetical protein EAF04_001078 [Stromatinia cepivora]
MAKPYITTSDKNGSLLTPMSAGSNTPISYRANVNRQKTKKWAEAKKIDYGGDDWGDDDEYDPYDAYGNEPAPAPVSKPTGLRQQGQGLASTRGMSQERGQKSYGNLPSATAGSALHRRNSFEADDETRHFSNSTIRQEPTQPTSPPHSAGSANVPATRFSQMGVGGIRHTRDPSGPPSLHISTQQPSPTGLRKPLMSANPAPPEASYNNDPMSPPARTNTNESSILSAGSVNTLSDYEASKDFSPSAVPAPLYMRTPPAPQGTTNEVPTTKFPARKSSLSTMGTEAQRIHQISQETVARPLATSSRRSPSPGSAVRSTTITDQDILNPLPGSKTTSPKLPDLHRISGFGSDFFSQSKVDSDPAPPAELSTEPPEQMSKEDSKPPDDTSLRSHPSFGFKSVVNQAFDITSDNSISPTPVSKTGSEVRRSDSESTGTTEISPIMSHGPSTAVSDNRSREMSTPAIMELVEPTSPRPQNATHEYDDQIVPPKFIPGHRRDISTPSPGNSPARTPDLGTVSKRISMGEQAWISSASPTTEDESRNAEPEPTLPTIDRDESFRPRLPGGWQSYTTTATTSTVQPESARSQSPQIPNDPVQDLAAEDLTPTTAKHSLPESSIDAARVTLGVKSDAMPTPDASGNIHSAMTPHPELIPTLKRASPEAQLRPDYATQPVPTESPPTHDEATSENLSNPSKALQQSTAEAMDTNEPLLPPSRPQVLPTLSTDTGPFDEQSDKLRKEIVKSLSSLTLESEQAHENLHERLDASNVDQPRESAYLTDVYDDYWNDTGDDEEHSSPIATTSPDKPQTEQTIPIDMPEIRPLSSQRMSRQQTRPPLPTRFSWEMSMESIHQADPDMPEPPRSHVELPIENVDALHEGLKQVDPEPYMEKEVLEGPSHGKHHFERDVAVGTGAAILGGGAAAATLRTSYLEYPPTVNVSLAQEKQQPQSASYPVTQTPENEQPAHGSTLDLSTDPLGSNPHSPASIPSPFSAREPSPSRRGSATSRTSNLGKILTFQEILGMKDVHERVHAFDETRERFAAMDSGIHDWISALKAEQLEHADVNESYGGFTTSVPTGSTRRNTRSASGAMQSPYYQQYLNASAPSQSSMPASRPGQTGSSGIQQGFTPAHAKITTQQVQAKGKEFLHHAGMFGGKAGKAGFQAGKGLLAKGKNRLRAAGSSDKTSPPPKPRHPNRSSWGLALSLSRATGRTDPSQHTEQNLPPEPTSRSRMSTSSDVLTPIGIVDVPTSDEEAQASHTEEVNVVSRETAGEILAPGGTEEQHLVNLPAPMSKYKPTWDPDHTTHITEEGHLDKDWQTNHFSSDPESTNNLAAPAGRLMSMTLNSDDAAFDDATEQRSAPKDAVAASSLIVGDTMQHKADLKPSTRPPISMMNRPRGASLDQAIIPDQPNRTTMRSLQPALPIQSTSQNILDIEEQGRQSSFKTLPPIRRTSKFGFEFGSRRPQTRFPISDDEDDDTSNGYIQDVTPSNATVGSSDPTSQQNARTDVSIANKAPVSKPNVHTTTQPRFSVFPRVTDPFVHKNHGQDVGRSNPAIGHTRQDSWNSLSKISRSRRGSASDQQFVQRPDSNAPPPMIPALPFESPPSSTQRYPELFGGPAVEVGDDHNMPGGYYQAPRGRTEAFLPRQPSNEISGGKPSQKTQEPIGHRRRRSSDLVSRGMNFVRSISRERKGSISRDEEITPMDTSATPPSRDGRQKKRGSGFWGNFDITGEQSSNSPIGRESMVAHYSGSQSNLMASPHESPRTPRSLLNFNPTLETPRSNILGRSTTTMGKTPQRDDKRIRLGGLSGLFSRSPKGDGSVLFKPKRATTDLSSYSPRGGTLSSPQLEARTAQDTNVDRKRRPSQPLNFLSKFAPSTSLQKTENPSQDSKLHQEPRPRRPSVSGLLTGMLRKRSNTLEKDSERSEDDGRRPMIVPVARMYSDLAAESREGLPDPVATPTQRLKKIDQERGRTRNSGKLNGSKQEHSHPRPHHRPRRHSTPPPLVPERQYDSVPIPRGYNLVRGDGTTAILTNYDPRGINNSRSPSLGDTISNVSQQYSVPSPVSPLAHSGSSILHQSPSFHQAFTPERRIPILPSIATHSSPFTSPVRTHYPSHEDILARSPAREHPGQQRPFQLALPPGSNANSRSGRSSTPPILPPKDGPVATRSPISVPLPADEFSPSNENIDIDRFPLPPSPPQHNPEWRRNRNLSASTDDGLRRSSTGRSLVSAVSQISDSPSPQPEVECAVEHILHVDGDNLVKRDSGGLYDASTRLLREDTNMAEKCTERKDDKEIGTSGNGVGVDREINEKAGIEDATNENAHTKEERLQMSATSYPGMEWNPYTGGYTGDE